jgi:hypothetical protein
MERQVSSHASRHGSGPSESADTITRSRGSRLLPDGPTALDLAFVLLLSGSALSGFATSFTGWDFLAVGLLGVTLAIVVTHVTRALRWPMIAPAVILTALFFVLGGPLCLRSVGDTAFLPGATLSTLTDQAVFGWKDMLTTLPPVDGDGPLLVLPWLLGLLAGFLGTALSAVRATRSWVTALLPVLGLTAVLVGVILLGVRHPHSVLVQGGVFAAASLGWLAVRARRSSATVHGGASGWGRVALGAGLVVLASVLAMPASAMVTGDDDEGRTVVRSWVEPPFDIGRYPSPLAGFRKYVDLRPSSDAANVFEKTLFTIEGAPEDARVRIATMDTYDGLVWGASNDALPGAADDSFQRVSSTIDNPVEGNRIEATVTIGEGYDGVWLPTIGALQQVEFRLGDPEAKEESFRYNLATSTAVVPSGIRQGDTYSFTAVQPVDVADEQTVASANLAPPPAGTGFLKAPANDWSAEATTDMGKVLAIADHLRSEGKYSDGVTKAEQVYHPGHHLLRLSDDFLYDQQMVGNDEQYAAVMALLANEVGVPARVVLGAVVPDDGVVTGADVEAWVELRAADGSWRTLATERFMSSEPPAERLPETNTPMSGTVVPPPAPIPPPSDVGDQSDAELLERKTRKDDKVKAEEDESLAENLPSWAVLVGRYVGGPLLLVVLVLASIIGLKALRRRHRRTRSSISARIVGAWRELVDHARDLGQPVPLGSTVTRREQSGSIALESAPALARKADSFVFGPAVPAAAAAASFWETVESERRAMSRAVGRRRRWAAAISLASLGRDKPTSSGSAPARGGRRRTS